MGGAGGPWWMTSRTRWGANTHRAEDFSAVVISGAEPVWLKERPGCFGCPRLAT